MKRAFITGIGGQDGSYLADILLEKGYEVHGLTRHSSTGNLKNLVPYLDNITLHKGDISDGLCMDRIIQRVRPDEVYHEADQDNVDWSFCYPAFQMDTTATAVANLLHSVLEHCRHAKVFIPVSATMFGDAPAPQTETTPFNPLSPYACGKVAAYHLARYYRQVHGMFVSTGILYNHESDRRHGTEYLIQKICKAAAFSEKVTLYNMNDLVDVGFAKDYMNRVYNMVQLDAPDDYIICADYPRTIRQIVVAAFNCVDKNYHHYVTESSTQLRPGPKHTLMGVMTKLESKMDCPASTEFIPMLYSIIQKYKQRTA